MHICACDLYLSFSNSDIYALLKSIGEFFSKYISFLYRTVHERNYKYLLKFELFKMTVNRIKTLVS